MAELYKIGDIVKRVQTQEFPAGTETPERLLQLWDATWKVWEEVEDQIVESGGVVPDSIASEIEGFQTRMEGYKAAIDQQIAMGNGDNAEGRNALLRDVINGGFLLNPVDPQTGMRVDGPHLPDFATPFSIANQLEVMAEFRGENLERFLEDLKTETANLSHEITERAEALNEEMEDALDKLGRDVAETFTPKIKVDLSSVLIIGGMALLFLLRRQK